MLRSYHNNLYYCLHNRYIYINYNIQLFLININLYFEKVEYVQFPDILYVQFRELRHIIIHCKIK